MSKKLGTVMGLMLFVLVAGCGAEKTSGFVGHWVETNGSDAKPMTLDISVKGDIFLIDEKKTLFGKDFESTLEGKADTSTTLSAKGGAVTARLENTRLFYKGRELVKSP